MHKESFNYFIQNTYDQVIKDNVIFLLLFKEITYDKYKANQLEEKKNINYIIEKFNNGGAPKNNEKKK